VSKQVPCLLFARHIARFSRLKRTRQIWSQNSLRRRRHCDTERSDLKFFKVAFVVAFMLAGAVIAEITIPTGMQRIYLLLDRAPLEPGSPLPNYSSPLQIVAIAVFGAVTMGMVGLLLLTWVSRIVARWSVMTQAERTTFFVSIIVGVGLSIPFHMLTFSFGPYAVMGSILLMIALIGIGYSALKSMEESMPWSRIPGKGKSNIKVFDTSVIIDGRIYDVAKSGFLEGKLYIPDFVLKELQSIADSYDATKRQRGRRGLDMLRNLQHDFEIEIGTQDRHAGAESEPVDSRLVKLAKALGASLVTNDFNLNKVAQVHGVKVLNVNDLAVSIRPQYVPNDVLHVLVEREGSQPGQGVGFLDDGTMVVIEDGNYYIGERIDAKVTQVHQSTAGRMIFATVNGEDEHTEPKRKKSS
jgi:uncharacterized protein YacL